MADNFVAKFKININSQKYTKELLEKLRRKMFTVAAMLERETKLLLNIGNRSGKNPSSPGSPPHTVTGNLKSSIRSTAVIDGTKIIGSFGVSGGSAASGYARVHELGGRVSRVSKRGKAFTANYPERPYLRAALRNKRSEIIKLLGNL